MKNTRVIEDYLSKLGFTDEELKLYISLTQTGPQTLLQASRSTGIERTRLYRLIDDLSKKGLIEEIPFHKHRTIKAADINSIELIIKQKQVEDKYLTDTYPIFHEALKSLTTPFPGNNVIYYHGVSGMRQMTWHILRSKGLFRCYSNRFWNDILGDTFVIKLNQELLALKFKTHDLYSDEYIEFKKNWLKIGRKKPEGDWSFWDSRYLPNKLTKIDLNIDIYNDVVAYYYWRDEEIFGVEIYNRRVAELQKQIHDILWRMSHKRPDINWTQKGLA